MTMSSDTLIKAAMMRRITEAEFDRAIEIALRVERFITCPITGRVLDSRTAQLLTVTLPGEQPTLNVVAADVGDDDIPARLADLAEGATWALTDARDVWKKVAG